MSSDDNINASEKLAQQGDVLAILKYGMMINDTERTLNLLRKAADSGGRLARCTFAMLAPDPELAERYWIESMLTAYVDGPGRWETGEWRERAFQELRDVKSQIAELSREFREKCSRLSTGTPD